MLLCFASLHTSDYQENEVNIENDESMTLEQTAAWLQLHPVSLRRLASDKMLPAAKVGKEWRFSRAALIEYLGDPAKWQKYRTVIH